MSSEIGIQINLVSEDMLHSMTSMEKIGLILDNVRDGHIIVLERGLTPDEERTLIERTMSVVGANTATFPGIEIGSYQCKTKSGIIGKILGYAKMQTRLTLIGRADKLKTIKRDRDFISTVVLNQAPQPVPPAPAAKKEKTKQA